MPRLLRLDSSADLEGSRTRAMTRACADAWTARGDDYLVVTRDLHVDPIPHLRAVDQHWPEPARRTGSVPPDLTVLQREVLDELSSVDAVVIGAPMYNFSMPSTLKSWIDLVHIPGLTASLPDTPPPFAGKPVLIATARGGIYDAGTPTAGWDHVVPPLQLALGEAMGMDVSVAVASATLSGEVAGLDPARAESDLAAALAACRAFGSDR